MEEDSELQKTDIIFFLYGRNSAQIPKFHKLRYQFIRCMGWDLRVTREECEEVGGWLGPRHWPGLLGRTAERRGQGSPGIAEQRRGCCYWKSASSQGLLSSLDPSLRSWAVGVEERSHPHSGNPAALRTMEPRRCVRVPRVQTAPLLGTLQMQGARGRPSSHHPARPASVYTSGARSQAPVWPPSCHSTATKVTFTHAGPQTEPGS